MDVHEIYNAAVAMSDPLECDAFIRQQCGQDVELREKLRVMLQVREVAYHFSEGVDTATVSENEPGVETQSQSPGLKRVGQFRIERLIGRGGMGNVFLAYDEQLRRPVALKFPRLDALGRPEVLHRFLQEARLAAQLNHPNLVKIYQVEVHAESCYIASEWCEGGDLAHWLRLHTGPQEIQWSVALMRAIARAVAYCHSQKIVHLDIKPANIILATQSADGQSQSADLPATGRSAAVRPMLTDFGVAKLIEEGLTKTHSSFVMGTPLYMAPEQAECNRDKIGPSSDIFAIGVVLHELLYGQRPFEGESAVQVMDQIRQADTLVIPGNDRVPRELQTICQRSLQYAPEDRYPTADALAEDLDRFLRGEPIHARPVSIRQKVRRWCSRPQRKMDAVTTIVAIQILLMLWVLIGIGMAGSSMSGSALLTSRVDMAMTIALITLPAIALAILSLRGNAWALYAAFLLVLVGQVAVPLASIMGALRVMGPLYDQQPFFKPTNLGLVLVAGLMQLFMLSLAMFANRKQR